MSNAWEVTQEDIETVLEAHASGVDLDAEEVFDNFYEGDRVEKAVLYYDDFDDQVTAALSEIEDVLIEQGIIEKPKQFNPTNIK